LRNYLLYRVLGQSASVPQKAAPDQVPDFKGGDIELREPIWAF